MLKAIGLLLLLVTGFVSADAGEENYWVGPSPRVHHELAEPQVGRFSPGTDLFQAIADTFGYDDGAAQSAFAWRVAGNGAGVKFISPDVTVDVIGTLLFFPDNWPVPGGNTATIEIYAANGPNGSPGTRLWARDSVPIIRGQWSHIPVGLRVSGDYYIFYKQFGFFPNCPGLAKDRFNNSPSGRQWIYENGVFAEDVSPGDWMIRSVVSWTPQAVNARAVRFDGHVPVDTVPEMNLPVEVAIGNYGTTDLPAGTAVRLRITGPRGYVYEDYYQTGSALARGEEYLVDFGDWLIPAAGNYDIRCWPDAAGEQFRADDTISYALMVGSWLQYADPNRLTWVSRVGPERAVRFNPRELGLHYPVELSGVRHLFWCRSEHPWSDSTFRFKVYAGDGRTLLYESPLVRARAGTPGPPTTYDFDSLLVIESGNFHISVRPVDPLGYPSSCADNRDLDRSYVGEPGAWWAYNLGEYFTAVAVPGLLGVSEEERRYFVRPEITLEGYPNPTAGPVTVRWNLPREQAVSVNLYDASGRRVQELYSARAGAGSGSAQADMRSLASGVYLLRLDAADGAVTRKLVIR